MAPWDKAVVCTETQNFDDGSKIYEALVDPEWRVGHVAFGGTNCFHWFTDDLSNPDLNDIEGFSLGMVLDATMRYQSTGDHPDPIYLSSQFLRALLTGPVDIHVKTIRKGKQFTNLHAEMYQKNKLMLVSQLIYGSFSEQEGKGLSLPADYLPLCPLPMHPSRATIAPPPPAPQAFINRYKWYEEKSFTQQNFNMAKEGRNEKGMTWGAWIQMDDVGQPDSREPLGPTSMAFFSDIGRMTYEILPKTVREPGLRWYPTLSMVIEFKARLPISSEFAPRTFGVFGWKRHMKNGRWNDSFEIWTSPGRIGEPPASLDAQFSWREKMICVAAGYQVALAAPASINARYAPEVGESKSKL